MGRLLRALLDTLRFGSHTRHHCGIGEGNVVRRAVVGMTSFEVLATMGRYRVGMAPLLGLEERWEGLVRTWESASQ
jgi:hypothetical protein